MLSAENFTRVLRVKKDLFDLRVCPPFFVYHGRCQSAYKCVVFGIREESHNPLLGK